MLVAGITLIKIEWLLTRLLRALLIAAVTGYMVPKPHQCKQLSEQANPLDEQSHMTALQELKRKE